MTYSSNPPSSLGPPSLARPLRSLLRLDQYRMARLPRLPRYQECPHNQSSTTSARHPGAKSFRLRKGPRSRVRSRRSSQPADPTQEDSCICQYTTTLQLHPSSVVQRSGCSPRVDLGKSRNRSVLDLWMAAPLLSMTVVRIVRVGLSDPSIRPVQPPHFHLFVSMLLPGRIGVWMQPESIRSCRCISRGNARQSSLQVLPL